jgi:hypothetical protein
MLLKKTILIVTAVVPVDLPSFVIFIARFLFVLSLPVQIPRSNNQGSHTHKVVL